jgi:AbrB family looped-hinge helix DNA binding protein
VILPLGNYATLKSIIVSKIKLQIKTQIKTMAVITLKVGEQGSMMIPAELRKQLGLEVGTELVATVEGDRLILETPSAILARLQSLFAQVQGSMSDELIAERKAEVKRELCN